MKTCKICKERFRPRYSTTEMVCSIKCAIQYSKIQREKKEAKEAKDQKKKLRKEIETLSDLLNNTQKVFNEYIRLKYKGEPCYTCGSITARMTCGHCFPQGSASALRFEEDNCRLQCWYNCNSSRSGNLSVFIPKLQRELGKERFEELERLSKVVKKYSKEEVLEICNIYKKKINKIKSNNK